MIRVARGNPTCPRHVTSLWGCPSGGLLGAVWRSKFFLEFLSRSFRLSRVSSEIWLSVGSIFKLGQMLRLGARLEQLQVSRNARFRAESKKKKKNTWRRDLAADTKEMVYTWKELEKIAQDCGHWRKVVDGLCSERGEKA